MNTTSHFDWSYLATALPLLLVGLRMTVVVALSCIFFSLILGYIGSAILYFEIPFAYRCVRGYIALIRNTPLLVQIFFFYFGLPEIGIRVDATLSGIIVLSLWGGAYQTENLRGALLSLPRALIEGARSLGIHPLRIYISVMLPVATRTVVPALMNTSVSITKNSALLTAIGVPEFTYVAMDNIASTYRSLENFFALFVGYLTVVLAMSAVANLVEHSLGRGFRK